MKILRNLHFVLSTAATLALAVAGSEAMAESHSTYPNELQGYTLHAIAKWKSLQPLISSRAEAVALLGTPEAVFYNAGPAWNYVVYYWSEQGSCNGHPFPSQLLGKVESIELVPKVRTSLSGVTFPCSVQKDPRLGLT